MREEHFESLYQLEADYWWFAGMRRITDACVGDVLKSERIRILDAGCGVGYNVIHYRRSGHHVFGFDIAPEAVERARRRGLTEIARGSVTAIPFASNSFDLVFSFDVLEQLTVEDAPKAVTEMARVLKPGGTLFVRTPAFQWLLSSHDADIRTVRRYTAAELERLAAGAGLDASWSAYANVFLLPVAIGTRLLKWFGVGRGCDVRPLPRPLAWLNPVFREILGGEASLLRSGLRLPVGLSAICVARKR